MNRFFIPTDDQAKRARRRVLTKNAQRQILSDMLSNTLQLFGKLSVINVQDGGAVPRCEFTPGGYLKVDPFFSQANAAILARQAWAGYNPEWRETSGL